ncbi:hypothetical protein GDO78_020553 [Eleutherodactylus coqui]|uniref:Uncharacterized protein n=1 Tax=Eleutherodactylus coqui TaxID=57060 RepID=A0A8J6BID6_ELECQ|nr:hypothetical protein GDO78_020553 [Eleutherodactylus coqui]
MGLRFLPKRPPLLVSITDCLLPYILCILTLWFHRTQTLHCADGQHVNENPTTLCVHDARSSGQARTHVACVLCAEFGSKTMWLAPY